MMIPNTTRRAVRWMCIVSVGLVSAMLGGCASSIKTVPTTLSASMNGPQTHESTWVVKGETLTVRLPCSGGNAWRLSPSSAANGFVTLENRREQQTANGGLAQPGEPAWDVFTFSANHTGQVSLEFICDNSWNADQSHSQNYTLDVGVTRPEDAAAMGLAIGMDSQ